MTDSTPWSDAAIRGRRIGGAVEFHPALGSTNDRARAALAEPGGEGLAVVADEQTAGRGRRGRDWLSPAGRNLMVSVGLHPALRAGDAWWLAAAAALAVVEAARPSAALGLKWPNDVVAGDGRKVAGLLLETTVVDERLSSAVIGIGINVNWARTEMPAAIAEGATSLTDLAGGGRLDRVALLARLLAALDAEVAGVEAGRSPARRYAALSALDGQPVEVALSGGTVEGIAAGIDAFGSLRVEGRDGLVTVPYGEVVRVGRLPAVRA